MNHQPRRRLALGLSAAAAMVAAAGAALLLPSTAQAASTLGAQAAVSGRYFGTDTPGGVRRGESGHRGPGAERPGRARRADNRDLREALLRLARDACRLWLATGRRRLEAGYGGGVPAAR